MSKKYRTVIQYHLKVSGFELVSVQQSTIQEEEHIAEQTKLLRLAGEKEREAEELKAKAKESR